MGESVDETTRREAAEARGRDPNDGVGGVPESAGRFEVTLGKVKVFHRPSSPWVEIEVPDGAIAIWARTGAVHPITEIGAVTDDPIKLPFPNDER